MSKAQRDGKIFIDYVRNTRGSTAVASYSTRARPGAPVATPLSWSELEGGSSELPVITVRTMAERLAALPGDPWADLPAARQSITKRARRRLGLDG
jgi:bifunctional non-homologous end joining protein LigD